MQASELILNRDGSIYHLHLQPTDISPNFIFVGDPARVDRVAAHFDQIRVKRRNREFYTVTGQYKGVHISVISTGIGPDNIDIVWNELDALANIDFETRSIRSSLQSLRVLRLGTCGGMQPDVPVGTLALSSYALGGDGVMSYYRVAPPAAFDQAWTAFKIANMDADLSMYTASADGDLLKVASAAFPDIRQGITFTAAGFYGPQGRALGRIPVRWPDLPERLSNFSYQGYPVLNMEMETAAILGLGRALGHKAGSLSTILANRQAGAFHPDPRAAVDHLIERGLELMYQWVSGQ